MTNAELERYIVLTKYHVIKRGDDIQVVVTPPKDFTPTVNEITENILRLVEYDNK